VAPQKLHHALGHDLSYAHEQAACRAEANGRADWAHALRTGTMPLVLAVK